MKITRARPERFGAILATEGPAALVSIDRTLARKIGIDGGALWEGEAPRLDATVLTAPTEAHVAVTDRCPAGCTGCYADARPEAHEPSFDELAARLRALADMRVFSVAFGGGEALTRSDLPEIGALARELGLTPTFTTSGIGMSPEVARALRVFAQVNVSHDGVDGAYREVRGFDGSRIAERAMAMLRDAGVPFGVNTVLTRASFDRIEATAAHAEALGAVEIQLVRFKPSGRGRLDYLARRCTEAQVATFPTMLRRLSEERTIAIRIDCAMVPFLAGDASIRAEDLVRFGVMGCEAGRSLLAQKSDGSVSGCSFWRDEAAESAGLVPATASIAWESDASLALFRAHHAAPPEPCASCSLRASCRGGCRIVARHVAGDAWAADPECPRVRAHERDTARAPR